MLDAQPFTVAVVDDNRMVREALAAMLGRVDGVTAVASDVTDAAFLEAHRPAVILLDAGLGEEDSLGVSLSLQERAPYARVIIMDLIPTHEEIAEYVNAGVCGFVLKDASFEELVATIMTVCAGGKVLPPRLTQSLFTQIANETARNRAPTMDAVRMTRREHEVVGLIGEGLSNKEIAQRLNIATHTVKSHVRNVMEKLALHTRLQIAAYSHREGNS